MKIVKRSNHKGSFEKTDEKEILTTKTSDTITFPSETKNIVLSGTYDITSDALEDLVSFYTEENDKNILYEHLELLGGTKGIMEKLKTSQEYGIHSTFLIKEEF